MLPHDIDIHTHSLPLRKDAIVCVDPVLTEHLPEGEGLISVGVHPWNADKVTDDIRRRMERWLDDPRVVAVGEVGVDRLKGPAVDIQLDVFRHQARIAAQRRLPVIVHCVRALDLLLEVRKEFRHFTNQWIYHGFRGKPAQAEQLLAAGIDLSFGTVFNPASFELTPPERRYRETD